MDTTTDRILFVPGRSFDDVLELASRAADRLDPHDPLTSALRGAIANARVDAQAGQ